MIRTGIAISAIAFAIAAGFAAFGWLNTEPGQTIPVHYNIAGEADRYGSRAEAFLFLPALLLGLTLMLAVLPSIDPRGQNLRRSRALYLTAWSISALALAGGQALISLAAAGMAPEGPVITRIGAGFLGLLLLALGLVMAKARPNFFAGFRTPWTLSSDLSWDKTHRWAGRVYSVLGLASLAAAALGATGWAMLGVLITAGAATLALAAYSYIVWRNDPARETATPDDA
ncbi:MAG: SdpI family protein [Maricaulaceae bacterium]|nr:SdpI family protein [Maricaulaceae bacterium]